jgi:hypothetical protein
VESRRFVLFFAGVLAVSLGVVDAHQVSAQTKLYRIINDPTISGLTFEQVEIRDSSVHVLLSEAPLEVEGFLAFNIDEKQESTPLEFVQDSRRAELWVTALPPLSRIRFLNLRAVNLQGIARTMLRWDLTAAPPVGGDWDISGDRAIPSVLVTGVDDGRLILQDATLTINRGTIFVVDPVQLIELRGVANIALEEGAFLVPTHLWIVSDEVGNRDLRDLSVTLRQIPSLCQPFEGTIRRSTLRKGV